MLLFMATVGKEIVAAFDPTKFVADNYKSTNGVWDFLDAGQTIQWKIASASADRYRKAFMKAYSEDTQKAGSKTQAAKDKGLLQIQRELAAELLVKGWKYAVQTGLNDDGQPVYEWKLGCPYPKFEYETNGQIKHDEEGNPIYQMTILEACIPSNVLLVLEMYPDFLTSVMNIANDDELFDILSVDATKR